MRSHNCFAARGISSKRANSSSSAPVSNVRRSHGAIARSGSVKSRTASPRSWSPRATRWGATWSTCACSSTARSSTTRLMAKRARCDPGIHLFRFEPAQAVSVDQQIVIHEGRAKPSGHVDPARPACRLLLPPSHRPPTVVRCRTFSVASAWRGWPDSRSLLRPQYTTVITFGTRALRGAPRARSTRSVPR